MVLGDFNHDGKVDIATSSNQLALGNGDGTFESPVPILESPPVLGFTWLAAGDVNNDGWTDLLATQPFLGSASSRAASVSDRENWRNIVAAFSRAVASTLSKTAHVVHSDIAVFYSSEGTSLKLPAPARCPRLRLPLNSGLLARKKTVLKTFG
jgi:hypothetical protein